jgi:uncharacterized protein YcaQ
LKIPDPNRTEEQYQEWFVLRRIGAVGLLWGRSGDAWKGIHKIESKERNAALARLLKQKTIQEIEVEGIKYPFYLRTADTPLFDAILKLVKQIPRAAILAPLDNLLWDRNMLKELFDFEYRWEVY